MPCQNPGTRCPNSAHQRSQNAATAQPATKPIAADKLKCRPSRPPTPPPRSANPKLHIPNGSASHLVASHPNSVNMPFPTSTATICEPTITAHRKISASLKLVFSYARTNLIASVSGAWSPPSASGAVRLGRHSTSKSGISSNCSTPTDVSITIGQDSIATRYARTIICSCPFPRRAHTTPAWRL